MIKNLGNIVSNVLNSKDRNFESVIFQQKRPPMDFEWNLVQDIFSDKLSDILKESCPSGFLNPYPFITAPIARDQISSSWKNALVLKNPTALVNGWFIKIGGGTNQYQSGAQDNIWKILSNKEDEIAIIGDPAPHLGTRDDLIFLEVWRKLIKTSDTIYKYGFVQSALEYFPNDLISSIEIETTKRVQIQYRIRWVSGVDFESFRDGLGWPTCFAQGGSSIDSTYYFNKSTVDCGLYVAGDGSETAQTTLDTIDGYVYAIPIARIHRRNQSAYALDNQNGAVYSLSDGSRSDRPDLLFYDEIQARDVEDLRHLVSLSTFNYKEMLEENLDSLLRGSLDRCIKRSPYDVNSAGNRLIQIDAITSSQARDGINEVGHVPDGMKRIFSDALGTQSLIFYGSSLNIAPNGKLYFTPIGHQEETYEYELFNETMYYIGSTTPTIYIITEASVGIPGSYIEITGGTWVGLGEFRVWSYLSGTRNKVIYTPVSISDIQGKTLAIKFELKVREGGGLSTNTGFTYQIDNMLDANEDVNGKKIDFTSYNEDYHTIDLISPRIIGNYKDSAIARSIHSFENSISNSLDYTKYKAATCECIYYKQSTGSTSDSLSNIIYNRKVLSILSIKNLRSNVYQSPTIDMLTNSFTITGLSVDVGDMLEYTLLLGDYLIEYVPHTKGIHSIAKSYMLSISTYLNVKDYVINVKSIENQCDGIFALTGFFNGISTRPVVYIGTATTSRMTALASVTALSTGILKISLVDSPTLGLVVNIPCLGYYNPQVSDIFTFKYEYRPYFGIMKSRLGSLDTQQVEIISMDEKIGITTSGTGLVDQKISHAYKGLTEKLPITTATTDFNFFGQNIATPISGGESSLRRIPGRFLNNINYLGDYFKEGQILDLVLNTISKNTLRGVLLNSPFISERGLDISPLNHMNFWTAIVRGKGSLEGELFLLVITTVCTIYNSTEGSNYAYLEEKGLYKSGAYGKGSETIIRNDLSSDLTESLGNKIIGSVDLFSLKYRPLKK